MNKRRLIICDTTLREGEQAPGCSLLAAEKLDIAACLEKLDVDVIEAGFAASSRSDFLAIQSIARKIRKPVISSFCRAVQKDIDAAGEALKEARRARIHVTFGTSDTHLKYKFNISQDQALERIEAALKYASRYSPDVQFTAEDAGRTDRYYLLDVIQTAAQAGATTVNLADTVGHLMPEEFAGLIRFLRENSPVLDHVLLSVHVHDDLGLALASTLAAAQAGANQAECTINGIGDRAGICALQEIVRVLKVYPEDTFSFNCGIRHELLPEVSRLVADYTALSRRNVSTVHVDKRFRSGILNKVHRMTQTDKTPGNVCPQEFKGRRRPLSLTR